MNRRGDFAPVQPFDPTPHFPPPSYRFSPSQVFAIDSYLRSCAYSGAAAYGPHPRFLQTLLFGKDRPVATAAQLMLLAHEHAGVRM